jgi:hypothetical protein
MTTAKNRKTLKNKKSIRFETIKRLNLDAAAECDYETVLADEVRLAGYDPMLLTSKQWIEACSVARCTEHSLDIVDGDDVSKNWVVYNLGAALDVFHLSL